MSIKSIETESFPIGVFPPKIREIIKRLHEACLFPLDFTAAAILFVASLLIGRNRRLVTTLGTTAANIYIVLVGVQGSGKSRPVEWAIKWLLDRDIAAIKAYKRELREWEEARQKGNGDGTPRPKCPRFLANDSTPEALAKLMSENPEGIGHYADEVTKLVADFSRYNKSRNEDFLISAFSGMPIVTDRATHPLPEATTQVYYCLIGTTQPARLVKIMDGDRFTSGFYARCLLVPVFDEGPMFWDLDMEPVLNEVNKVYGDFLEALEEGRHAEIDYVLDKDAKPTIQVWQNRWEERLAVEGQEHEQAIFRKIQIYVLKFALLLQIIWDVAGGKDNPNHIVNGYSAVLATELCDYFFGASVDMATTFLAEATLSAKEQQLYTKLPPEFDSATGQVVAEKIGLGKTSFYSFLSKVKGILVLQVSHGHYIKTQSRFRLQTVTSNSADSSAKSRSRSAYS